jgi:hypothetical protein
MTMPVYISKFTSNLWQIACRWGSTLIQACFRQVLKIKETRFLLGVGVFFFDDFKNMGMSGDLKKGAEID